MEQGSHDELMALGGAYWTLVHTQQQGGGTGDSEEEEEEYEGMGPLTLLAAVPEVCRLPAPAGFLVPPAACFELQRALGTPGRSVQGAGCGCMLRAGR